MVFGSSTAGGAYQPGLSDYNIFVRGGAKVFLGGPPLVKVATGEDATDEELGGAQMHASVSGLADYLADGEPEAIRMARDVVAHLHWRKQGPGPVIADPEPPRHDPADLLGLMPRDLRAAVDAREIIARVVDGSRFEEFKARYGPTLVTGWARIHGFDVGILASNGVLFSDSLPEGGPVHPAVQPGQYAAGVLAAHHRVHGGPRLRAGRDRQARQPDDQRLCRTQQCRTSR